jgi:hypothetical protein
MEVSAPEIGMTPNLPEGQNRAGLPIQAITLFIWQGHAR